MNIATMVPSAAPVSTTSVDPLAHVGSFTFVNDTAKTWALQTVQRLLAKVQEVMTQKQLTHKVHGLIVGSSPVLDCAAGDYDQMPYRLSFTDGCVYLVVTGKTLIIVWYFRHGEKAADGSLTPKGVWQAKNTAACYMGLIQELFFALSSDQP